MIKSHKSHFLWSQHFCHIHNTFEQYSSNITDLILETLDIVSNVNSGRLQTKEYLLDTYQTEDIYSDMKI